jgi:hypothetical protein
MKKGMAAQITVVRAGLYLIYRLVEDRYISFRAATDENKFGDLVNKHRSVVPSALRAIGAIAEVDTAKRAARLSNRDAAILGFYISEALADPGDFARAFRTARERVGFKGRDSEFIQAAALTEYVDHGTIVLRDE